ncbi:growth-regulating factor 7-like [Chenopodium quinoa]|uniref:growth-regulating factor 7-like n=1 Tax=Chenopodium quinoa TaxID=63459 RepID=UPI000B788BFB|nr:growth-regulating factor 7-like [Chenopodium quinoa]
MKKNSENGEQVVVVELGLKLNQQDQDRSFLNNQTRRDDHDNNGGDGNGGPRYNNMMISDTPLVYCSPVVADNSPSSVHCSSTSTTTTTGVVRGLQQPFDVSSYYTSANPFYKSSVGIATATMGFPFTATQWKELERQAMIYKYMMASLPVPPDLLYSSFPTNFSYPSTFSPASYYMGKYGSGISMRWSGNSKDAEPGRCRRTDGKKWRCSRDVAPNQKYCERHMHRGRPRSRKHVEQQQQQLQQQQQRHQHSLSNLSNDNKEKDNFTPAKKTRLSDDSSSLNPPQCVGSCSKASIFDHSLVSPANPFEDSRNLGWNDEQQWNQLVQTNMNSSVFQQQFEGEPLNLNSQSGHNPTKSDELGLLERPLFDAWSIGMAGNNKNNGSSKLSLSSSNGGNSNVIDDEMCQIHMGLGLIDSWVSSSTTPGGPLAEVLRPGNMALSDVSEVEFVTPPATAVSSPSGVLQKTLATFSDSSESNSPTTTTCHNSKANSDMPFHWLN